MIGQRLLHYEIIDKLGEGGMGIVYKARDTHLDRFVAIKVLPPEKVADTGRKARFVQEAKAASALSHPNIITIYDISSDNGVDFIAMEFVEGRTLDQIIPHKGMRMNEALKIAIQIADALARAHAAGIIHRDLKPANIMVDGRGHVKVLDFGLAKLTEASTGDRTVTMKTEEGAIVGTAAYMSPEQAEGKPLDARSDIFSFGAVLYEMLSGRRAFQGDSKMSTLSAVIQKEPEPLGTEVPADLAKLVARCVRKEPARRFQHFDDIQVALDDLRLESESGKLPAARQLETRHRRWPWIAGLLAVAAATVTFWQMRLQSDSPDAPLQMVPLTSYQGNEFSPSLSPDGTQVVFGWYRPEPPGVDLYVKQIGVDEPFRLTNTPEWEASPKWSPDGLSIAFLRGDSQRLSVIVVPQRGGPERVVTEFVRHAPALVRQSKSPGLDWMPDSKSIVVTARDSEQERTGLWVVSVVTGERRRLIPPPQAEDDLSPSVSPDGRMIVFSRHRSEELSELHRLDVSEEGKAEGAPVQLARAASLHVCGAWTGDGKEIVFTAGSAFFMSLWRMAPLAGAHPRRIPLPDAEAVEPTICRRGNRLVYVTWMNDTNIWKLEIGENGRNTKAPVRFSSSTMFEFAPDYSPDGRRVTFMSTRSGSPEIWVCDNDGTHPVQVTSFGGPVTSSPRWSPDGRWIAFHSDAGGTRDVYVVGQSGGSPRRLTEHPAADVNPNWSRDGKWIYYTTGGSTSVKMPSSGGTAAPLFGGATRSSSVMESPDGRFLYFGRWEGVTSIWRAPIDGSGEEEIVRDIYPYHVFRVANDGVYFVAAKREAQGYPIRFRHSDTGRIETLAHIPGTPWWGLAVSPDRRTILFSQTGESRRDLRMVDNFH